MLARFERGFNRGISRGIGGIKKLASVNNANKFLTGANQGLRRLGNTAREANNFYNQLREYEVLPETSIGNNVSSLLQRVEKLA
jgi:hypothetical protein